MLALEKLLFRREKDTISKNTLVAMGVFPPQCSKWKGTVHQGGSDCHEWSNTYI